MRRACLMTIMILLGSCAAQAQSASTTPGIGATSPLGMLGSSSSVGTGVPLGATEIDPGGLSPLGACVPSDPSMLGASATGSTFDGGGLASATSSCASGTPNITSTGIASPLSGAPPNLAGGTIPLGSTELDGGGLSPMITVPAPVVPAPDGVTGCTGSLTNGSDPTTSMNLGTVPGC
ncbi:hypothetical protein [Rhodoplanes sp. Z2-YC6860]|uniref:hypothetical protein n=1 Tax=Rhodoplanes sp. Z2-YC6860 TaxID=674703 RepID=UPI00078D3E7B|nr:hypothetical protein [Rhodoplanes sp. Z2-YC6860]AMN42650.1 hypothetical protein RHPLAN_42190 [Rhodoplanes sp. Z2-YC6860]